MEPGKTSFFQALGIPTKIAKGIIEIVNQVHLIKAGNKVGPSEATLLNMMNISPFTYGLSVTAVYDNGAIFDSAILDVKEEDLVQKLVGGIQKIAAISLALNYPTVASVPHSLINGYKKVLSIALVTEYSFPAADKVSPAILRKARMKTVTDCSMEIKNVIHSNFLLMPCSRLRFGLNYANCC